jgi:diaminopimelate epimerase
MMATAPLTLSLTKHHGLGNDFLVLLDVDGSVALTVEDGAALARQVCARHTGVGADGLLIAGPAPSDGSADVGMRLHNADGGVAEMSGNGIRCLAQAVVDAGAVAAGPIRIQTDGGLRVVEAGASDASGVAHVRVAMGAATLDAVPVPPLVSAQLDGARFRTVDVGNPHLVVDQRVPRVLPDGSPFMASFGPRLEAPFLHGPTGGINVEAAWVPEGTGESGVVAMEVWERGVGVTQACGTGACATAAAARAWGWCGDRVTIRQPGGDAVVELQGSLERPDVVLVGPTQRIGRVEYRWRR